MSKPSKHRCPPIQPVVVASDGVIRFQANVLVTALYEWAALRGFGLNELALIKAPPSDREQLAQLLGYSVSGFGDLSYARRSTVDEADKKAEALLRKKP